MWTRGAFIQHSEFHYNKNFMSNGQWLVLITALKINDNYDELGASIMISKELGWPIIIMNKHFVKLKLP